MNGVIHNCSHGAGTDVNTRMTEEFMMCKVFQYLDHLVQVLRTPFGMPAAYAKEYSPSRFDALCKS